MYGGYNCAFDWKTVGTLNGACLELDPNDFPSYNSYEILKIKIGMNVSDHIGGWEGYANPGTVYTYI